MNIFYFSIEASLSSNSDSEFRRRRDLPFLLTNYDFAFTSFDDTRVFKPPEPTLLVIFYCDKFSDSSSSKMTLPCPSEFI